MTGVELAILIAAGIVAGIDELSHDGKNLLGWAVILIVIGLLWSRFL